MKRLFFAIALCLGSALPIKAQNSNYLDNFYRLFQADSLERNYLSFTVVDLPYQTHVVQETGNGWCSITNQSMATSLDLTEDFQIGSHLVIRKIFDGKKLKPFTRLATYGWDVLSMFLPFGSSWIHEEYHRAVMGLRGVESFDEVWCMKLFANSISVSHETDEAMAHLHDNYINDFIRMNAAGLEGQTHLNQRLQRNDFFYHRNLMNGLTMWMNTINNIAYLDGCADPESDKDIQEMNDREPQIKQRDFTGYDLSAWSYELFHPGVKYAQRGTHPSGVGINRYITYDMIGDEGIDYLKKEAKLEYLNLLSPMMFGVKRIPLWMTKQGRWYGNFAMRHYLTHYGNDISLDLLFETPSLNFIVAPHVYSNYEKSFPGMEFAIEDKQLMNERLRVSASAQLWSQPEGFRTTSGKIGGLLSADVSYAFSKQLEGYMQLTGKTAGWVVGNVYLDGNISCRAGFRWLIAD